jgi:hypothetical protein
MQMLRRRRFWRASRSVLISSIPVASSVGWWNGVARPTEKILNVGTGKAAWVADKPITKRRTLYGPSSVGSTSSGKWALKPTVIFAWSFGELRRRHGLSRSAMESQ